MNVGVRFQPADLAKLDAWCTAQGNIGRPEAIRAMVGAALEVMGES